MSGQVAEMLEFIPNIKTETLAALGEVLTDEEFDALSPSQQATLTEAVEEVEAAEGDTADTAYEYLEWLERELSPGATVEILEGDAGPHKLFAPRPEQRRTVSSPGGRTESAVQGGMKGFA